MAGRSETTTRPLWPFVVAGIIVAGGVGFYLWWLYTRWEVLGKWGALGDSVAPFIGLLTGGALLAAVWSVLSQREELRLQRQELELQRAEMKAQREEMAAQREQFERTAKAQEKLAASQKRLANAQENANRLALGTERAQCWTALTQLYSARSTLDAARYDATKRSPGGDHEFDKAFGTAAAEFIELRIKDIGGRIEELDKRITAEDAGEQ